MLDLDSLAERRATSLNQNLDGWKKAIWGSAFQKLTQNMTDGEVEALVAACPSVGHLEWVVSYLDNQAPGAPPFTLLLESAKTAGLSPEEWIRRCFTAGQSL